VSGVLLAQLTPVSGDPAANAATVAATLGQQNEVGLAVFPDAFLGGYDLGRAEQTAVALDGPEIAVIRGAAKGANTAVIIGFSELRQDSISSSLLAVDGDGAIVGVHRRTVLWGEEADVFEEGDSLTIVNLMGRSVGLMLCYEVEFPEISRALAIAGADLLVTASANADAYYDDHDLASRARALDNRLPHIYVNRVGSESGVQFAGGTRVVDDQGRIVAAAVGLEEEIFVVEVPDRSVRDGSTDYVRNLPGVMNVAVLS
jgi:predicted amidohydrolase